MLKFNGYSFRSIIFPQKVGVKMTPVVTHSHKMDNKALILLNEAKTKILTRVSHEIRTPMNVVLGIAEMQMQREGLSAETEEAFSRIYTSSSMLLLIVNDILDLVKVEDGKMEVIPVKYDITDMIADTVQLNLMHVGSKRIKFELNIDENVPMYLVGDSLRIKQIMNNILSNAFKYTTEGIVSLDIGSEPALAGGDILILRVRDTGQGMTDEQIDSLFDIEFTRYSIHATHAAEGSGLGMNIARQLIGLMGGEIRVESEIGKGTTITIRIPQERYDNRVIGKETVDNLQNLETAQYALKRFSKLNYTTMPYGRVLVVDDVESNLYVAKGLLQPYKLTVDTADNGRAAIEKVESGEKYDIIFMDYMMPGMDGIETARAIQALGYEQPIVALTANTMQSELFTNNVFSGFISKPIDINRLNAYLLRLIRDKQPQEILVAAQAQVQYEEPEPIKHIGGISARLRESFITDATRSQEIIRAVVERDFLDDNSIKLYIIHTHALKSALYNVGETILSAIAGALEQAGREGDIHTMRDMTDGFLNRLNQTTKDIRDVGVTVPHPPRDTSPDEEKIIFVVDDSDTNLILAEEALEDMYTVFTILSAAQMFKMLGKVKPDLILLDIEMPDMDGYEALEKLKSDPKHKNIPVIFLTATVTPEATAKGHDLGAIDICAKPFTPEGLQKSIRDGFMSQKPTVLIIDDTAMIISSLSRILLPHYGVKIAKSGGEGLKLTEQHRIDLILLDIHMPFLSGFDVMGRLKESDKTKDIPVIFITGSDEATDEAQGFALGAVDFIKKPFVEANVLHRVATGISGGKA